MTALLNQLILVFFAVSLCLLNESSIYAKENSPTLMEIVDQLIKNQTSCREIQDLVFDELMVPVVKLVDYYILKQKKLSRTLSGHRAPVYSVCFSPDGSKLASGSKDRTINIRDIKSGKILKTLLGHEKDVNSMSFSPDGTKLASGSDDRKIKIWDVTSWKGIQTLVGHSDSVISINFSPKDGKLASGSRDKTIKIWDVTSGEQIRTIESSDVVNSVCYSPDGTKLASGLDNGKIKIWDMVSWGELQTLEDIENESVNSVCFSSDGTKLASGSDTVKIWDIVSGKKLKELPGYGEVDSVCFSPDGTKLASKDDSETITIWDVSSGKELKTLKVQSDWVNCLCYSPDGTKLVAGDKNRLKIWDLYNDDNRKVLEVLHSKLRLTPNQKFFLYLLFKRPAKKINLTEMEKVLQAKDNQKLPALFNLRSNYDSLPMELKSLVRDCFNIVE